jgi:hypothetical protein
MQLTAKEEKIARLALDKGAKDGERAAAAVKLIESLRKRGVTVEDLQKAATVVEPAKRPEPEPYAEPASAPAPAEPVTREEFREGVHVGAVFRKILLARAPRSPFEEIVWILLAWLVILCFVILLIAGALEFFQAYPAAGIVGLFVLLVGFMGYLQSRAA